MRGKEGNSVHDQVHLLLPWYVNSSLDARERDLVEGHLRECSQCRRELEDLGQLDSIVKEQAEEDASPDEETIQKTLAQLRSGALRAPVGSFAAPEPAPYSGPRLNPAPRPSGPNWRSLAAAVAIPVLAATVGYQSFFQIPRLKEQKAAVESSAIYQPMVLGATRGSREVLVSPDQHFVHFEIDLNLEPSAGQTALKHLSCSLRFDEDGSTRAQLETAPADTLYLRFPTASLPEGMYSLVVAGLNTEKSQILEQLYQFELKKK